MDLPSLCLYSTMTLLDYYFEISGLKINYTKLKAILIGSKKYSKNVYHHTLWKLDWGTNQFMLLGIKFTLTLEDIVIYNLY